MKNSLILLITLFLFTSCKKQENQEQDLDLNEGEVTVTIKLMNPKSDTKVTVTAITDDGHISFDINENVYNKKFKVKKGYTFATNCMDSNIYMSIIVLEYARDEMFKKTANHSGGYNFVAVSSNSRN